MKQHRHSCKRLVASGILFGLLLCTTEAAVQPPWVPVTGWAVQPVPKEYINTLSTSAKKEVFRIKKNPDDIQAWAKLSVFQFNLGQFEQAALSFRHLLRLQPTFPFAYTQYMQSLYLCGDVDTVRWLLEQDTEIKPRLLPTEMLSAQLDLEAEDYERARKHLETALGFLDDPEFTVDKNSRSRLKNVVLNNLIHLCRLTNDEASANNYRLKLAENTEVKLLDDEGDAPAVDLQGSR